MPCLTFYDETTLNSGFTRAALKVFISYASEDLETASSVFNEVAGAGAEVFQFGRSEIVGKPSWDQVLEWISQSDVFVMLVSKHSLKSKPVKEEVEQAHYSYINSDRPEKLIPAILDANAKPPRLIERFTHIDFTRLEAGMDRLMKQLNLARRAKTAAAPRYEPPNLSKLFEEFKIKYPDPIPASQWSADAENLLATYKAPKHLGKGELQTHLDWLLKEDTFKQSAQSHSLRPKPISPLTSFKLKNPFENAFKPLDTPQPELSGGVISWSPVTDAESYEVQKSLSGKYGDSDRKVVYSGPLTSYTLQALELGNFRVKAVGKFRLDSEWSTSVKATRTAASILGIEPVELGVYLKPGASSLDPPKLTQKLTYSPYPELSWSSKDLFATYVLERSENQYFFGSTTVYEGYKTEWTGSEMSLKKWFYRVKAVDTAGRASSWSNVLEC
jgi:hypothetical protein